jgi:hypothetical protein
MPDYYSNIIREVSVADLSSMLQAGDSNAASMPEYTPIPRRGYQSSIPDTYVGASEAVTIQEAPTDVPDVSDIVNSIGDDDLPEPTF